ncbi:MAG: hypothetical protein ACYDG6_12945 [Thermincolia bacterium]
MSEVQDIFKAVSPVGFSPVQKKAFFAVSGLPGLDLRYRRLLGMLIFVPFVVGLWLLLVLWVNHLRFRDGLCNWIGFFNYPVLGKGLVCPFRPELQYTFSTTGLNLDFIPLGYLIFWGMAIIEFP